MIEDSHCIDLYSTSQLPSRICNLTGLEWKWYSDINAVSRHWGKMIDQRLWQSLVLRFSYEPFCKDRNLQPVSHSLDLMFLCRFNMWLHLVLILFHLASPVSRQHRQQVQAIRHASLKIRNRGPGIVVKEVNIYRVHTVHPSLFLRTTPWQWEACISWTWNCQVFCWCKNQSPGRLWS